MQTTISINKYKSSYIRFHFSRQTAATLTIWSLHQSLIGLCWVNFRHVTVGHVLMAFTPHGPATKHRSRPQRDGQPSQRKLYCFPISALSVMRASSHRNTAHKRAGGPLEQSAEDSSPLEMRQGSRWQEKGWLRNRCLQQKPIQLKWTCSAKQPKWLLHQTFWRSSEFRNLSNTRQTQTEEQKKQQKKRWWKHFWRCSSHSSPHRSTRPWPISVCFAFIWATALRGVECQTQHLWLSTASWQQVSVFLTCFSKTRKHVWSCVRVCICTRSAHHMPLKKVPSQEVFFLFSFFSLACWGPFALLRFRFLIHTDWVTFMRWKL